MKKRLVSSSFDELIKNHYGGCGYDSAAAAGADDLLAGYYGNKATRKEKKKKETQASSVVQSLSYDDGETLQQQHHQNGERFEEYVVQQSQAEEAFEEYVLGTAEGAMSMQSSVGPRFPEAAREEDVSPMQECQVDIFPPPKKSNIPGSKATAASAPSGEPAYQQSRSNRQYGEAYSDQSPSSDDETSRAKSADDEFMADMQSILSGQMVYDPNKKKTIKKDELGQSPSSDSSQNGYNEPPVPEAKNSQAIFDRIAQSMQFANAYDLGTVELENRFSDFDRISEIQERAAKEKKATPRQAPAGRAPTVPPVDSADFIRDLDAIQNQRYGTSSSPARAMSSPMELAYESERSGSSRGSDSACTPWALSLSATENPHEYSRPLYDTGEHVQTGWDLFTDQLRVGKNPGLMFSYGELIAMPDLYESVSQMMGAEVSELQKLKTLIQRSTAHYKGQGAADVTNSDWETATRQRYLELAEDNYEHFSPDVLFTESIFAKNISKHRNNKATWEKHHRWAIEEAQKMFLDPANAQSSFFPEWPLIINAFGDHFLTDAFASGHVINKEAIIEYYKYNFYNGNSLKSEGGTFFDRVSKLAFKGDVERKFSVLETYEGVIPGIGAIPIVDVGHPNISSADRFSKLLKAIAEQKPDQIANLAVKALHDRLNHDGIEVTNDAGDGVWMLTGDGTLNAKNLGIIKKAVQQSVDNINDPAINGSNLDFGLYFSKVWSHVPRLTEASKKKVKQFAREYTSPDSELLIQAAAKLITEQVDTLISKLIKAKKLRHE